MQVYFGMQLHCIEHKNFLNTHVDEHEFNMISTPKPNSRFPQYTMTNDPEKVWPGGIVHYAMDASIGKLLITPPSCMFTINVCIKLCVHVTHTYIFL